MGFISATINVDIGTEYLMTGYINLLYKHFLTSFLFYSVRLVTRKLLLDSYLFAKLFE